MKVSITLMNVSFHVSRHWSLSRSFTLTHYLICLLKINISRWSWFCIITPLEYIPLSSELANGGSYNFTVYNPVVKGKGCWIRHFRTWGIMHYVEVTKDNEIRKIYDTFYDNKFNIIFWVQRKMWSIFPSLWLVSIVMPVNVALMNYSSFLSSSFLSDGTYVCHSNTFVSFVVQLWFLYMFIIVAFGLVRFPKLQLAIYSFACSIWYFFLFSIHPMFITYDNDTRGLGRQCGW
jgi:hypothetical protein